MKLVNGLFSALVVLSIVAPAMAEPISAPRSGWISPIASPTSPTTQQSTSSASQPSQPSQPSPAPVSIQPTQPQVIGIYAPRAGFVHR